MRPYGKILIALALSITTGCGSSPNGSEPEVDATATYQVLFQATWSVETHPQGFPPSPHFSGLIGAIHKPGTAFWGDSTIASPGVEQMAETGRKSPLDSEIAAAIQAGTARSAVSGDGINRSPGSVGLTFEASRDFPLVTLVSMIAPSPDWFVGVSGLNLLADGKWTEGRVVELHPYDAGTDDGASYTSPNQDTVPPEPVSRIRKAPFGTGEGGKPVGTFTFTRL